MAYSFGVIFVECEFGEMITYKFDTFNEELCESRWYLFSNEMQRMILIFISNTQQPVYIRGYGNIVCARDAFKQVKLIFEEEKEVKSVALVTFQFHLFQTRPFTVDFLIL